MDPETAADADQRRAGITLRELEVLQSLVGGGTAINAARRLGISQSAVSRRLAQLETYRVNTTEASFLTGTMQTTLDEIQIRSELLSQVLLAVELTPNDEMFRTLSTEALSLGSDNVNW